MHSMMKRCNEPSCRNTTRHTRTTDDNGDPAWKCGNCYHIAPVKKQGQASTGVYATLIQQLTKRDDTSWDSYTGYITFEQLRAVMQHHSTRKFDVSAPGFGLVSMDPSDRKRWLSDEYRVKRAERLAAKTGRPVEASVTLYVSKGASGFTHDVHVHGIYAFSSDERKEYYPYD
jgi:hypothetical protein